MENIIFGHVTGNMLLTFFLGIFFVFLYSEKTHKSYIDKGYNINRYLKWSWLNLAFQIIGGLLILTPIDELGEFIVGLLSTHFPNYNFDKISHMVFSALAGMLGAPSLAWLIEKMRKKSNEADQNIKHIHTDKCEH